MNILGGFELGLCYDRADRGQIRIQKSCRHFSEIEDRSILVSEDTKSAATI